MRAFRSATGLSPSVEPVPVSPPDGASIPSATDVNLSAILERELISKIERYPLGRFSVVLMDGRIGVGGSVGEALERAKQ